MKKIVLASIGLILSINIASATGTEALLFYNKAIDYYKMGLYEESIDNFRKSISADPEFIDAYFNLGSVYEFLQQYDEALGIFKQIILRAPEDYDAVYHAAWLSYKVGELDKAKMYLTLIPSNCERAQDAQRLYELMGVSPQIAQQEHKNNIEDSKPNNIFDGIDSPTGVAVDDDGNIYVAQFSANTIIKITPNGKKILFIKNEKLNGPVGVAFDQQGNMYVANYNDNSILKITNSLEVTYLIKNVSKPYDVTIKNGTLYVSLQGSSSVLKYKLK